MIHVALLRAVNLPGHNRVAMADLRRLLSDLGFANPRTLLQSGNAIFGSESATGTQLERLLERATAKQLGVDTDYFVRTATQWRSIVADNPFPDEARVDPAHLVLTLLKDAPTRAQITALQHAITGREVVRANGDHVYVVYPDGIGRSRLTPALTEKHLGTFTGRNWNTVLKLDALTRD
jgi:uncharacterized protein (DUF1697 family)